MYKTKEKEKILIHVTHFIILYIYRQNPLVIFGHTARVWDCQFVDQYLISISEDATCRVWKNTLVSKGEGDEEGDCLACWEGHIGKNVWSFKSA